MRLPVVLVLLAACASDVPPSGPCSRPDGLWLIQLTERAGGSCGALPDQLVQLGQDVEQTACGDSQRTWADDSCSFQSTQRECSTDQGTAVSNQLMTMHQTDANTWAGIVDIDARHVPDGRTCRSAYDAIATKR